MTLFDPNPRLRWLFCMTHPDDEIAICAWMAELTRLGAEVWISWTHDHPVREAEARRFAATIGVPAERLRFFGATDGHVCDEMSALLPRFHQMMNDARPDRVVCGAFEQGHLDHDATNYLVNQTFAGTVLEIPLYHAYVTRLQVVNRFADPTGQEIRSLSPVEMRFKKDVAKMYPSQNIWSVLRANEVWTAIRGRRARLFRDERMRIQTHRDFRSPNLPPYWRQRVLRSAAWKRWLAALDQLEPKA